MAFAYDFGAEMSNFWVGECCFGANCTNKMDHCDKHLDHWDESMDHCDKLLDHWDDLMDHWDKPLDHWDSKVDQVCYSAVGECCLAL